MRTSSRFLAAAAASSLAATVFLAGPFAFAADKNCDDFRYQEDAQDYFNAQGYSADNDPEKLDDAKGQGNGVACESRPHRPGGAKGENDDPQVTTKPQGGVETGGWPGRAERATSVGANASGAGSAQIVR